MELLRPSEDTRKIQAILGLEDCAITGLDPKPKISRLVGAGRVKAFPEDQKNNFIPPPSSATSDLTSDSESTSDAAPKSSNGRGEWPHYGTALDFRPSATDVLRKAAWSWYRTGVLYERSANSLRIGGIDQNDLGLRALKAESVEACRAALRDAVSKLMLRSMKAKAHALKLFPQLLEEGSIERPTWGAGFTASDQTYYEEMALNNMHVRRAATAIMYKKAAYWYALEALSLYVEMKEVERKKLTGLPPREENKATNSPIAEAGGMFRVWQEAAQNMGASVEFRRWWIRAAMARGHAEWLEKEPYHSYASAVADPNCILKTPAWRLHPPGPASTYRNDCAVIATAVGFKQFTGGSHKDKDPYDTFYNLARHELFETGHRMDGVIPWSGLFGAPDFVFLETSLAGWLGDVHGLLPEIGISDFESETVLYQKYMRKGVYDVLPESASEYDKALAICADDVFFEGSLKMALDAYYAGLKRAIVNDLKQDLEVVTKRRATMTRAEARRYGFEAAILKTIHFHSDRLCEEGESLNFQLILKLQYDLSDWLAPWYTVQNYMGKNIWRWALAEPGRPFTTPKFGNRELEPMTNFLRRGRLWLIENRLEDVRAQILKSATLRGDDLQLATCFRQYLETGMEEDMPKLAVGRRRKRDLTFSEYYRTAVLRCASDCRCGMERQDERLELAKKRQSNDPGMVEERRKIRQWFIRIDGPSKELTPSILAQKTAPNNASLSSPSSSRNGVGRYDTGSSTASGFGGSRSSIGSLGPPMSSASVPTTSINPQPSTSRPPIPSPPPEPSSIHSRILRTAASVPAMGTTPQHMPSQVRELDGATDDYAHPVNGSRNGQGSREGRRNRVSKFFRRIFD